MFAKLAVWGIIGCLVFVACWLYGKVALAMILVALSIALAASEIYSRRKTDKEYLRDTEAALLICRYSEGIDHKGRRTGKIIR